MFAHLEVGQASHMQRKMHTCSLLKGQVTGLPKEYNLILSMNTVSALIDWVFSKGAPRDSLTCSAVMRLLKTVKAEQGPAGLPIGKTGMSKDLLGKLLTHVAVEAKNRPTFAPLLFRDSAWLVLGFWGLLRRSELVALRMSDVALTGTGTTSFIAVRVRHSKTDRRGVGVDVLITGHTCGRWDLTSKVTRFQKHRIRRVQRTQAGIWTHSGKKGGPSQWRGTG